MPRKPLFRDPVRFSINLEKSLVERLDAIASELGIERNRLINRLLEKYIDDPEPFSSRHPLQVAAEDPHDYGKR